MINQISDYEDFLNCAPLEQLKEEAREYKATKENKGIGYLILRKTAEKLPKSRSNKEMFTSTEMRKYETSRYISASGDQSSLRIV